MRASTATVLGLVLLGGCGGDYGSEMRPGEPCLTCHGSGGEASDHAFTVAGTIYDDSAGTAALEGVTVTITDKNSVVAKAVTNSAGNFYIRSALTPPLRPSLSLGTRVITMHGTSDTGDCNGCHSPTGASKARIYLP